jgi:hypothetical protein
MAPRVIEKRRAGWRTVLVFERVIVRNCRVAVLHQMLFLLRAILHAFVHCAMRDIVLPDREFSARTIFDQSIIVLPDSVLSIRTFFNESIPGVFETISIRCYVSHFVVVIVVERGDGRVLSSKVLIRALPGYFIRTQAHRTSRAHWKRMGVPMHICGSHCPRGILRVHGYLANSCLVSLCVGTFLALHF